MQIFLAGRKRPRNWEMNVLPLPREDWWSRPTASRALGSSLNDEDSSRSEGLPSDPLEKRENYLPDLTAISSLRWWNYLGRVATSASSLVVSSTSTKFTRGCNSFVARYFSIRRKWEHINPCNRFTLVHKDRLHVSCTIFIKIYGRLKVKSTVILSYCIKQILYHRSKVFKNL